MVSLDEGSDEKERETNCQIIRTFFFFLVVLLVWGERMDITPQSARIPIHKEGIFSSGY